MYRAMVTTRLVASSALAVLVAIPLGAGLLVTSPGPAAAGGCTFVAAVDPAPDEDGSQTLTVEVGEVITFWGTFVPNATVNLFFEHDGVPFGDFTPGIADASGEFLFIHDFTEGQEGSWTVTAAVPETECAGTVALTVLAAGGAPATPTATPTATPQPAVPDTALSPATAGRSLGSTGVFLFVILLAGASLVVVRDRVRTGA